MSLSQSPGECSLPLSHLSLENLFADVEEVITPLELRRFRPAPFPVQEASAENLESSPGDSDFPFAAPSASASPPLDTSVQQRQQSLTTTSAQLGQDAGSPDENSIGMFHRFRASVACTNCRLAKRKCDGLLPCSRCVDRQLGDLCRYDADTLETVNRFSKRPKKPLKSSTMTSAAPGRLPAAQEISSRQVRGDSVFVREIPVHDPVLQGIQIYQSLPVAESGSPVLRGVSADGMLAICSCLSAVDTLAGADPSGAIPYRKSVDGFMSIVRGLSAHVKLPNDALSPFPADQEFQRSLHALLDRSSDTFKMSPYYEFMQRCPHLVTPDFVGVFDFFSKYVDPHKDILNHLNTPPSQVAQRDWFFSAQFDRARQFVDRFPYPCMLSGHRNSIIHVNAPFLAVSMWTREQLLSKNLLASWLVDDECMPSILKVSQKALLSLDGYEIAYSIPNVRLRRRDGKQVTYCAAVAKIFDSRNLNLLYMDMFIPMDAVQGNA
eukprot:ANDGO_05659.mRNA.1 hypothetical protein